jgi:hypothetical protein
MKKVLSIALLLGACLTFAPSLWGADEAPVKDAGSRDLSREKQLFRNYVGDGSTSVSSFCVEGHVFVMVSGDISNNSSLIQVYEERNGKALPKRCN